MLPEFVEKKRGHRRLPSVFKTRRTTPESGGVGPAASRPAKTAFPPPEQCRSRKGRHHADRDRSTAPVHCAGAGARATHAGFRRVAPKAQSYDHLSSVDVKMWTCSAPK